MHWEQSGAKGAIAIDYGRVQVDGGKGIDPLADRVVDATQQLNECSYARLDQVLAVLVQDKKQPRCTE